MTAFMFIVIIFSLAIALEIAGKIQSFNTSLGVIRFVTLKSLQLNSNEGKKVNLFSMIDEIKISEVETS